jgi:hypothetical protein
MLEETHQLGTLDSQASFLSSLQRQATTYLLNWKLFGEYFEFKGFEFEDVAVGSDGFEGFFTLVFEFVDKLGGCELVQ